MKKVYVKVESVEKLLSLIKLDSDKLYFVEFNISNEDFETYYKLNQINYDDVIVLLDKNNQSYSWVKWNGNKLEERY